MTDKEERRYAELQLMALDYARAGDAQALGPMIEAGLPVNLCDGKGNSLLMLAAYHGNADAVRMLLTHGADPERKNARGQTPLAGVAFKGDVEVARLLVDGGADPAAPCSGGQTPIQFAVLFGQKQMYRFLLDRSGGKSRTTVFGIPAGILIRFTFRLKRIFCRA